MTFPRRQGQNRPVVVGPCVDVRPLLDQILNHLPMTFQRRPVQNRPQPRVDVRPLTDQILNHLQMTQEHRIVQNRPAYIVGSINRHIRIHEQLDNRKVAILNRFKKSLLREVKTQRRQRYTRIYRRQRTLLLLVLNHRQLLARRRHRRHRRFPIPAAQRRGHGQPKQQHQKTTHPKSPPRLNECRLTPLE